MFSRLESSFKTRVGQLITWPIRWQNEDWPQGIRLSDGNMPISLTGIPLDCCEGTLLVTSDESVVGAGGEGHLPSRMEGEIFLHLSCRQGIGTAGLNVQIGAFIRGLKRRTIYDDTVARERLMVLDSRIDDGLIEYSDGNRFCRTLSFGWVLDYHV